MNPSKTWGNGGFSRLVVVPASLVVVSSGSLRSTQSARCRGRSGLRGRCRIPGQGAANPLSCKYW